MATTRNLAGLPEQQQEHGVWYRNGSNPGNALCRLTISSDTDAQSGVTYQCRSTSTRYGSAPVPQILTVAGQGFASSPPQSGHVQLAPGPRSVTTRRHPQGCATPGPRSHSRTHALNTSAMYARESHRVSARTERCKGKSPRPEFEAAFSRGVFRRARIVLQRGAPLVPRRIRTGTDRLAERLPRLCCGPGRAPRAGTRQPPESAGSFEACRGLSSFCTRGPRWGW